MNERAKSSGKPPEPGERRALRKKIALNNANAIEIKDLQDLTPDNASGSDLWHLHPRMVGLQQATVDSIRALEGFKHTQGWSFFRRPATLVRRDTLRMANTIEQLDGHGGGPRANTQTIEASRATRAVDDPAEKSNDADVNSAANSDSNKGEIIDSKGERSSDVVAASNGDGRTAKDHKAINAKPPQAARWVLTGVKGTGKSVLQLQAMALALQRGWILVHIPDGHDLTIGHTAYEPISAPSGVLYIQPTATAKLLSNILNANRQTLMKLRVSKEHKLPVPLKANMTLADLVYIGAAQAELAWPVYQAFWAELCTPADAKSNVERPKVLYTMDGMDHAMQLKSGYLDRLARPVHAHRLALINHFMSMLSGKTELPNGGLVLGATSGSNRPSVPTFDICLSSEAARKNLDSTGLWNPFIEHDKIVQQVMRDVNIWNVEGINRPETRGIIDYYAKSGMLRDTVTDALVSEQWALSGRGIIGEIERATLRMRA
jgi:hypothetical protein